MAQSDRIRVVLTLAERAEQEAAQRLKHHRDQVNVEERQLAQLQDYRAQYLQQYQGRKSNLHASEMISYSAFIQRLAQVLTEQERKLVQMHHKLAGLQQQWHHKYHRRQSVEDLVARLKREENDQLERRLQQELDELTAQRHWRHRDF